MNRDIGKVGVFSLTNKDAEDSVQPQFEEYLEITLHHMQPYLGLRSSKKKQDYRTLCALWVKIKLTPKFTISFQAIDENARSKVLTQTCLAFFLASATPLLVAGVSLHLYASDAGS